MAQKSTDRCDWCESHILTPNTENPQLCGHCNRVRHSKSIYETPKQFGLPPDEGTSEDEYMALVLMDTSTAAQEIMDVRILRVKEQIQDTWNDLTRERRSMYKKKVTSIAPRYRSWATRNYVFFEGV